MPKLIRRATVKFMLKNNYLMETTGNLPLTQRDDFKVSHHLSMTGDPGAGIMKCHDTFQVGSQSINISGANYNKLNSFGNDFNPSPAAGSAFRSVFGTDY